MASHSNNKDLLQAVPLLPGFSTGGFVTGGSENEVRQELLIETENSNTSKKTRHDVALFIHFLQTKKNEKRPLLELEPDTLDGYIANFLIRIRQKDNTQYEPSSLRSIFASLERYLKINQYSYALTSECRFEKAREALRSKQKELKQQGKGNRPNAARAITEQEQELLYIKGILGMHNAEALLNTIWWNVTRFFGMRAGAEQHKLQWGDVSLRTAPNGVEFCEFNERQMKVRSGADLRTISSVCPKMWAISKNGDNARDPVAVYKKFSAMRPAAMKRPDSPFYLAINNSKGPDWFKCQPLGINTLKSLMKKMFTKAALPTKGAGKITNHSARKTMMESVRGFLPETAAIPIDLDIGEMHSSHPSEQAQLFSTKHFVGGNGPTREHPDPLPVRPMNMLQSTAGYAEAGPSNQGYTGKPETSRRKKIATATVSSETVLIPDDSPPQPTAPKLQKKQIDDRRFDERRFEEQQRFQERRFENRRFDERRQQMAAAVQSAQVAAPSLQIPPQMQVKQHLQVAPPPPPPLQAPRQVQVLAPPPVQVPVPKPKPVEKPRPREKRIFVVADHQRCVMSNLASLWKSGKLCDAGIGNGSSTVMVHKVVLSAVCPKLLSVFSTDILSHKFLQVNFPEEVSTEALNAFAEYMYNGILDLDPDILQQLKIIAKRLDMKEFEQLCDSHLPNQHHQPVAAAATSSISFNNLPLIQTSVPIIPSIPTSHQTSLSSLNISTSSLPSVPSITTQVIDVKQEISEAELDQVKKDTAAVFGEESQVVSLAPNQSGNAGFVISPSIKTEPIGPEDDKYGRLGAAGKTNSSNNQVYTSSSSISAVPSSSISSLSTAAFVPPSSSSLTSSSILSSIPTSSTEYAIPFTDTIDIKTTELKLTPTTASTTYVTPSLMPDLSSVTSIVEAVCSQPSAMNEDSTKPLTQQQPSLSAMSSSSSALEGPSLSSSGHDNIYPVGLFTAEGDNLPLLTTQTVGIKTIDLYKTDLT